MNSEGKVQQVFFVRYQLHRYSDLSDNPTPREWKIKAYSAEEAFGIAQLRAQDRRDMGRKIGHVFREMRLQDGSIVVAEGDYPPDFRVEGEGRFSTIYRLYPLSTAAQAWVAEHISDEAQWFGAAVIVEHRYIADLITGIQQDGLFLEVRS